MNGDRLEKTEQSVRFQIGIVALALAFLVTPPGSSLSGQEGCTPELPVAGAPIAELWEEGEPPIDWVGTHGFSVTPDGLTLYFDEIIAVGDSWKGNLWRATREDIEERFGESTMLTGDDYKEGWPRISPDGKWLYFYSNRPGTLGASDIFAWKLAPDGALEHLVHLEAPVNTAAREAPGCIYKDEFYFISNSGSGWRDIRVVRFKESGDPEAGFTDPRTLSELNTPNTPLGIPSISSDGTMLFFSDRPDRWQIPGARPDGQGGSDIWVALRSPFADGTFGAWSEPQNFDSLNTELNEFNPWPYDEGRRLLFLQAGSGWVPSHLVDVSLEVTLCPPPPLFRRSDCNGDGDVNLADASCTLNWLFAGAVAPGCIAALNTNGDDKVDLSDAVALLNFLFAGGAAPVTPYPDCGLSTLPEDGALGCANPPNCQSAQ